MWISAEILDKRQTKGGFSIIVQYGTDDLQPITQLGSVLLGPGQDESTLKGAIVQQLADLNAQSQKQKDDLSTLSVVVAAIAIGPVDLGGIKITPLPPVSDVTP